MTPIYITPVTLILPADAVNGLIDALRSTVDIPIGEYEVECLGCVQWGASGYSGQIVLGFDTSANGLSTSWTKGRAYAQSGLADAGGAQKLDQINLAPAPNDAAGIVPFILKGNALFSVAGKIAVQVMAPSLDPSDPVTLTIGMLLTPQ